ncbi:MAG: hypothetical protein H0V43_09260 [Gemmatimonadales bacterium]|nr:hypothetical protein [Gemmatimonadales bacterium]MBA3555604.1 hypothetical protein [Gemmatimonadales bacterium]
MSGGANPASPREVRLRAEHAALYPELPVGEWLPAAQWANAIVVRAQEARQLSIHRRTFDPHHFEFRGGPPPRPVGDRHLRTRAEDR